MTDSPGSKFPSDSASDAPYQITRRDAARTWASIPGHACIVLIYSVSRCRRSGRGDGFAPGPQATVIGADVLEWNRAVPWNLARNRPLRATFRLMESTAVPFFSFALPIVCPFFRNTTVPVGKSVVPTLVVVATRKYRVTRLGRTWLVKLMTVTVGRA